MNQCFQNKRDSIRIPIGWKKKVWFGNKLGIPSNTTSGLLLAEGGLVLKYIGQSLWLDIDSPSLYNFQFAEILKLWETRLQKVWNFSHVCEQGVFPDPECSYAKHLFVIFFIYRQVSTNELSKYIFNKFFSVSVVKNHIFC